MFRLRNGTQAGPSRIVSTISSGSTSHTAGSAHLLKGLIRDSRNTVLLERRSPSPALDTNRV
jgi:hypothetical protein